MGESYSAFVCIYGDGKVGITIFITVSDLGPGPTVALRHDLELRTTSRPHTI